MRERTIKTARSFGLLEKLQALEADLLKIQYIPDTDFDVDNYDEFHHVILLPHYDIPVELDNYYDVRRATLTSILKVCQEHDLHMTGDRIEDMGEHWYIVRNTGESWPQTRKGHKWYNISGDGGDTWTSQYLTDEEAEQGRKDGYIVVFSREF